MKRLQLFLFLPALMIDSSAGNTSPNLGGVTRPSRDDCPSCKTVSGGGGMENGNYEFHSYDTDMCDGGCVYTKADEEDGSLYCFQPGGETTTETCDEDDMDMDYEEMAEAIANSATFGDSGVLDVLKRQLGIDEDSYDNVTAATSTDATIDGMDASMPADWKDLSDAVAQCDSDDCIDRKMDAFGVNMGSVAKIAKQSRKYWIEERGKSWGKTQYANVATTDWMMKVHKWNVYFLIYGYYVG